MLAAEAFWVAATVNTRQGHSVQDAEVLQYALAALDSQEDLTRWMRLWMAAASLALRAMPRTRTPRPTSGPSNLPSGWPGPPAPPRVPLPQPPTRLPAGRPGCRRHAPRTGRGRRPSGLLPRPGPSQAQREARRPGGIADPPTRLRDLATSVQQLSMPDLAAEASRAVADRARLAA
jgi:hypothetical protein